MVPSNYIEPKAFFRFKAPLANAFGVQRPAREWSRRNASDIDGQAEEPKERDASESKLSEFNMAVS
jgi:hypothetical protein